MSGKMFGLYLAKYEHEETGAKLEKHILTSENTTAWREAFEEAIRFESQSEVFMLVEITFVGIAFSAQEVSP